ncbi:dual specificity protein kinase kns1 [Haplosporangium sp. Z 11]|nr:dual specificity protein kinase kns1 [Haplosporangium sp. Z 11]
MATSQTRSEKHPPDWADFYRNGPPKEIIVIEDDSPPPPPQLSSSSASSSTSGSTFTAGPAMVDLIPLARKKRRPNADPEYPVAPVLSVKYAAPALTPIAQETHPYYPHHPPANGHGQGHDQDNCAPTIASVPNRYTPVPIPPWDDKEGHYIVNPGDQLTSRYKIMRQLGQGTFGKVVECYDRQTGRYCAIKVIRAVQKYRDASKIEIRVLNTLKRYDPRNSYKCLHLNEHFDFRNHVCMVFDLLGQSIYDWLKDNHFCPFPPNHLQHFARQLLTSVAFLHRLRLIHTDLKPENILLVSGDYKEVPYKKSNTTTRRVLLNPDIRLIDFGSATFQDEHHSSVVSTRHYRAPEIILIEFLTGEALFQTHDNLEHLAMMEVVLGRFPDRLIRASQKAGQKYFVNGRLDYPNGETKHNSRKYVKALRPLEDYVMAKRNQHDNFEVAQEFLDLLYRLLAYDPADRITAAEALRHPYFDLVLEETGRVVGYRDLL